MKCRCRANRPSCDVDNPLCPASTVRMFYDERGAIRELYDFAWLDEKEKEGKNELVV